MAYGAFNLSTSHLSVSDETATKEEGVKVQVSRRRKMLEASHHRFRIMMDIADDEMNNERRRVLARELKVCTRLNVV